MRKSIILKDLDVLTHAAQGAQPVQLAERPRELAEDEILVAVVKGDTVTSVKLTLPEAQREKLNDAARLRSFAKQVAIVELAAEATLGEEAVNQAPSLTPAEERRLTEGGFNTAPFPPQIPDPIARAQADFAALRVDSLSVIEAARLLKVNSSRVRQRLTSTPPTLYGIKLGKSWRLPRFQFQGHEVVPGIEKVVGAIPSDLDPVSVWRWFTSTDPDLELSDGMATSPLNWLKMGKDGNVVADLAKDL